MNVKRLFALYFGSLGLAWFILLGPSCTYETDTGDENESVVRAEQPLNVSGFAVIDHMPDTFSSAPAGVETKLAEFGVSAPSGSSAQLGQVVVMMQATTGMTVSNMRLAVNGMQTALAPRVLSCKGSTPGAPLSAGYISISGNAFCWVYVSAEFSAKMTPPLVTDRSVVTILGKLSGPSGAILITTLEGDASLADPPYGTIGVQPGSLARTVVNSAGQSVVGKFMHCPMSESSCVFNQGGGTWHYIAAAQGPQNLDGTYPLLQKIQHATQVL